MNIPRAIPAALTLLVALPAVAQSVIRVDPNATGSGSGATWANAVTDLQTAINRATDHDEIWIRAGTYQAPEFGFLVRDKWNVKIRGGFAGDEAAHEDRGFDAGPTVLTAERGNPNDPTDNALRVMNIQDTHPVFQYPLLLEDLTITGGYSYAPLSRGAGITNSSVVLTVRRCVFENNTAEVGGAIWSGTAQQTGWLWCVDTVFRNNRAVDLPTGDGDEFLGGAVFAQIATFVRCSFENNHSDGRGGALQLTLVSLTPYVNVFNCRFDANSAGDLGGALSVGNTAAPSRPMLVSHSTFTNNTAGTLAGAVYGTSQPTIKGPNRFIWLSSCAFWNNDAPEGPDAGGEFGNITRCLIRGYAGDNFEADPEFRDADASDFRPAPGSPLIDAGWDDPLLQDVLDFDGDEDTAEFPLPAVIGTDTSPELPLGTSLRDLPGSGIARLIGASTDIGAYEHCPGDVDGDGRNTTNDFGAWLALFNAGGETRLIDLNRDGVATPADFTTWLRLFAESDCR